MRKIISALALCFFAVLAAKSERIPSYKSFVYWIQGEDTVYTDNSTLLLEAWAPDGTMVVRVRHEERDNMVNPKSTERLAPWHAVISQRRGIRSMIQQNRSNTDAMMAMKSVTGSMFAANKILALSARSDKANMNLASEYMIDNVSDQEIMVNDINRGLVWHIPAQSYLLLNMGTLPQACLLRIANTDPANPSVRYVVIGSASYSMKLTVAYEDEDCWIYLLNEEGRSKNESDLDFSRMLGEPDNVLRTLYVRRDKDTFQEIYMPEKEVFAIIKTAKAVAKEAKKKEKMESKNKSKEQDNK